MTESQHFALLNSLKLLYGLGMVATWLILISKGRLVDDKLFL